MINETLMNDLHAYSLKRQTILSEQNRINYRLSVALKDFHERWEPIVLRAAVLKCNLVELDANFQAKYPLPEPELAPSTPKHVPVPKPKPEPVPNQEINLEPLPTLSYWETYPPAPAPPLPATLPAFVPASVPTLDTSVRFKQADTAWIVTPEHFVMYCKIYPRLMTVFNTKALKETETCKDISSLKASVLAFFKRFVWNEAGFDTTKYVKACLAHAFVIQYPQYVGMFDAVHVTNLGNKALGKQLDALWKVEGMPVYK